MNSVQYLNFRENEIRIRHNTFLPRLAVIAIVASPAHRLHLFSIGLCKYVCPFFHVPHHLYVYEKTSPVETFLNMNTFIVDFYKYLIC